MSPRIAGAPISWGVCEVPAWGYQMPAGTVLTQMGELGLAATEFGPEGFLPSDPTVLVEMLGGRGLRAVGGFEPVVLHTPDADPVALLDQRLAAYVAAGADTMILAAVTGADGYETRPVLTAAQWARLLANLDRIAARATDTGIRAVLHPHVGTVVENATELDRVLGGSAIGLCLDTGHLTIGGVDPGQLARTAADRIGHVHCKDVDLARADAVREGRTGYAEAVRDGLYRPLGQGGVDIAKVCAELRSVGYDGWWVLEQDVMLSGPDDADGAEADVAASLAFLRGLL